MWLVPEGVDRNQTCLYPNMTIPVRRTTIRDMLFVPFRKHLRLYNAAYQLVHGREGRCVWPLSDGSSPHTIGGPMYVTVCIYPEERAPLPPPRQGTGIRRPHVLNATIDHSTWVRSCANRTAHTVSTILPARINLLPVSPSPHFSLPLWLHPGASAAAAANSSSLRMPRNVSLICACNASARIAISNKKASAGGGVGCEVGGRTGPVDRRCVLLIRALHIFFERREARSLSGSPAQQKNGVAESSGSSQKVSLFSKGAWRVPGLLPVPESGEIG